VITPRGALALLVAAGALTAAGCGGGSSGSDKGGGAKAAGTTGAAPAASTSNDGGYGYGSSARATTSSSTTASAAAPAAAGALKLSADEGGGLYFDHKTLKAKAGRVTIVMTNPGSSGKPHGIAIEGQGVDKDGRTVGPGGTSKLTVTLKPGTYTFYCPVPGHEAAGMKGTLTVS
jgi:uncharacterized cupredoxin-like copper-binding protein